MLLAIDVGNSNMVLGLYRPTIQEGDASVPRFGPEVAAQWRITTPRAQTSDEFGMLLRNLFDLGGVATTDVTGIAISSVVPPLDSTLRQVCETFFRVRPLFVEPGVKTGLPVLTDTRPRWARTASSTAWRRMSASRGRALWSIWVRRRRSMWSRPGGVSGRGDCAGAGNFG